MSTFTDEILDMFIGDPAPPIKRFITGYSSFDRAFENARGEIGMPIGAGYEIFGTSNTGKSTVVISLSGDINSENVSLADLEGFDSGYYYDILKFRNFQGKINILTQGKTEDILYELAKNFRTTSDVAILDSIGAIVPIGEEEGDMGSERMGLRAKLLAQFARRTLSAMNPRTPDSNKVLFLINHYYPVIGKQRQWDSPGGEVKKYLASIRIALKRKEVFPDGSYILEGNVKKNRYGFRDRTFYLFIKAGVGIHKGLTALIDGTLLGVVSRGKTIKIGETSYGYLKNIITKEWENHDFFVPFMEAIDDYYSGKTNNVQQD